MAEKRLAGVPQPRSASKPTTIRGSSLTHRHSRAASRLAQQVRRRNGDLKGVVLADRIGGFARRCHKNKSRLQRCQLTDNLAASLGRYDKQNPQFCVLCGHRIPVPNRKANVGRTESKRARLRRLVVIGRCDVSQKVAAAGNSFGLYRTSEIEFDASRTPVRVIMMSQLNGDVFAKPWVGTERRQEFSGIRLRRASSCSNSHKYFLIHS